MGVSTALEALTAELLGDVGKLHDKVQSLQSALPEVSENLRGAGRDAAKTITAAVAEAVSNLNRAAADAEVARIQAEVGKIAQQVLIQVRNEAKADAPHGWKLKIALAAAGVILLGGLAGGIIGAVWFGQASPPPRTDDEVKQLAAGRDFIQVLPQLDQATRDKVVKAIQKNQAGH